MTVLCNNVCLDLLGSRKGEGRGWNSPRTAWVVTTVPSVRVNGNGGPYGSILSWPKCSDVVTVPRITISSSALSPRYVLPRAWKRSRAVTLPTTVMSVVILGVYTHPAGQLDGSSWPEDANASTQSGVGKGNSK